MKTRHVLRGAVVAFLSAMWLLASPEFSHAGADNASVRLAQETSQKPASGGASGREKAPAPSPDPGVSVSQADPAKTMPVYKPPLRGAPGGRVGGGTRGIVEKQVRLSVLAPNHVGLTVRAQPDLYWFISGETACPIEFTITEIRAAKPLLEKRLDTPPRAGIQCIRLKDLALSLKQDVPYQWFVVAVVDPNRRSKDILSGGAVQFVASPPALREKLRKAGKNNAVYVYAEEGLWYDAIAAVSDLIQASPKDPLLRKKRAALLQQAGLHEAAEFDQKDAAGP